MQQQAQQSQQRSTLSMQVLSKLSTARGNERSRVWLEGKRLADYGFSHGTGYQARWSSIGLVLEAGREDEGVRIRYVAGTASRPIIDITGAEVREQLGSVGPYVSVTYALGRITIRPTTETK
jgi:hypothetical protein